MIGSKAGLGEENYIRESICYTSTEWPGLSLYNEPAPDLDVKSMESVDDI
jgi:hypothetical protein